MTTYMPALSATLTCVSTGESISLTQQIAESGEGEVWQTNRPGYLAKIYHHPRPERIRKLEVMVANPPEDPNARMNHISFAWPKSLLKNGGGDCVGFLMPAIANSVELLDVYSPRRRQQVLPGFNWLYLHTTALNIASIVRAIHAKGYVLGDIKPQNILVNNQALPAIIDTDSFQVRDPQTGAVYRCPVGSEGFTPVELLGKDLAVIEQTEIHDRFRLAVVIYLLLFGDHPFKGKWIGAGDSPDPTTLLRQGFWPYAPHSLIQTGPLTISLDIVHPEIQKCFLRCFNAGHTDPSLRPTAQEWYNALRAGVAELTACQKVKRHYYSQTYGKCYWCERKQSIGVDIFSATKIVNGQVVQDNPSALLALRTWLLDQIPEQIRNPILNHPLLKSPLLKSPIFQHPVFQHSLFKQLATNLEQTGILKTRFFNNLKSSPAPIRTITPPVSQPPASPPFSSSTPNNKPNPQIVIPAFTTASVKQTIQQIRPTWEDWLTKLTQVDVKDFFKTYKPVLTGFAAVIVGVGALFTLLVLLSRSKMSSDNMELTITGIVLCLGLVGVCFLLAKVTEKLNL